MCQAVIDIKAEGREEELKRILGNALQKGHTPEQIADFSGISLEEVIRVQKQLLQET